MKCNDNFLAKGSEIMSVRCGIFSGTEEAVRASKAAYERFSEFSLRDRGEVVEELRSVLGAHGKELAAMEKEETGMGVYEDKLCQIMGAVKRTPGASFITQKAVSDEEGLLVEESFPYGVSCVIHPVNHPVASIINHTIMMLAAGNSVINIVPRRAEKTCVAVIEVMNYVISNLCGIDNLVICMEENRYENNRRIMEHPDVSLVVVTGGTGIVNKALCMGKRVVAAGCANPVVIVDSCADVRNAAREIARGVSFDNNLLCTSEKSAVVLSDVHEEFMDQMVLWGACRLNGEQQKQLEESVFDEEGEIRREYIGQDAETILAKAGLPVPKQQEIRLIVFDAELTSPFVMKEVAAPILPVVEVPDFEESIDIARFIEQGYGHSAGIFSKNIDHLSEASRAMQTSVFVKNGSSLCAAGVEGNTPISFTIANVTGEGAVTPKTFTKRRKCVLKGAFERR